MKKFTLLRFVVTIAIVFAGLHGNAQVTTINTSTTTGYNGSNSSGTNGFITFVITNTSGATIKVTEVGNWATTSHNNTTSTLWYTSTSLSGPVTLAGPTWTSIASNTVTGVTSSGVFPVLPGLNFEIPNNATYRFAVHTSGTNNYTSGTPAINSFTAAGVTMYTGNYQISGLNVGYAVSNNPRFFTGYITFEPACTAVFTKQPADVGLCSSDSTTLTVAADAAHQYRWQLDAGSGWVNLGNDAIYSGTGTNSLSIRNTSFSMNNYRYRAVATNTTEMCDVNSDPATLTMIASSNSSVVISAAPGADICEGEEVVFHSAYTKGGATPKYRWLLNGLEMPGETNATLKTKTLDHGDIVICRFISSEQCVFESLSPGIKFSIVNNLVASVNLSVSYNGGSSYTFIADPVNGGTDPKYVWYLNGQLIPNETGQSFTSEKLAPWDKVEVGMLTSRDCAMPKLAKSRLATTSVSSVEGGVSDMVLAPNPNKGSFTVSAQTGFDKARIYIANAIGQVVYNEEVNTPNGQLSHSINLNSASAGIYIIRVESSAGQQLLKFTIAD